MKLLIIGCGGIGSWLVHFLDKASLQVDMDVEIHVADFDSVEVKNIDFQNFDEEEVMRNKAESLKDRYQIVWKALPKKINEADLKEYDFFITAVDNFEMREKVIRYCYGAKKNFLDLRCDGRSVFVMLKGGQLEEDLKTLEMSDKESGSCQKKYRKEEGKVDYGNMIAASMGLQMFLNYQRNEVARDRFLLFI